MKIIGDIDICGDTHGIFGAINYWISHSISSNLIHVGDWGVGFKGVDILTVSVGDKLNKAGKKIFVTVGNHDNPNLFDNRIYGGEHGGVYFLRNGTVAEWGNEKILFNGGGLSLDRSSRIPNLDYWDGEEFKFVEVNEKVDHLVTHISLTEVTGKRLADPFVLGWCGRDADLMTDLTIEQQNLQNWLNYLIDEKKNWIKSWYYGHYHQSISSRYRNIECRCLAINEIRPFNRKEY